jgi:N-acetyl-anhydromuramyl-L-alanine amidase AmpD
LGGLERTAFNMFSIGIEIINLNGNLFPYTEAQYAALTELLAHLIRRFPVLARAGRIVGHEDIAGFRGKCDPGVLFDWARVLNSLNLPARPPGIQSVFTEEDRLFAESFLAANPAPDDETWSRLSSQLEARIKARGQRRP